MLVRNFYGIAVICFTVVLCRKVWRADPAGAAMVRAVLGIADRNWNCSLGQISVRKEMLPWQKQHYCFTHRRRESREPTVHHWGSWWSECWTCWAWWVIHLVYLWKLIITVNDRRMNLLMEAFWGFTIAKLVCNWGLDLTETEVPKWRVIKL